LSRGSILGRTVVALDLIHRLVAENKQGTLGLGERRNL
jgi:hypothetical protein